MGIDPRPWPSLYTLHSKCTYDTFMHVVISNISIHTPLTPSPSPILIVNITPVIVHDGVETMGYGEDGTVGKLFADGLLNEVVCLQVHGCSGLIQHQDLGLT